MYVFKPHYNRVVSILFSIIPVQPQYVPNIPSYIIVFICMNYVGEEGHRQALLKVTCFCRRSRCAGRPLGLRHVSCSPHSLKGALWETIPGISIGLFKGDTRSVGYSSCEDLHAVSA